jgi:hypothetical protein
MLRSWLNASLCPTVAIEQEGVRQVRSAPSSRRMRTTLFDPPASTQNPPPDALDMRDSVSRHGRGRLHRA